MILVPLGEGYRTQHLFLGVPFCPRSILQWVFSCGSNAPQSQSVRASFCSLSGCAVQGPEQCVLSSASVRGAEITHCSCWVSLCCFSSVCAWNVLNPEQPALNHIFLWKRTEKVPGIYVCVWHFCSLFPISLSRSVLVLFSFSTLSDCGFQLPKRTCLRALWNLINSWLLFLIILFIAPAGWDRYWCN